MFCSLPSVYELKVPFHYLGLQVDGCSRGRADARRRNRFCRFMYTAMSRLLQAVRSCTHTSVPSLVKGVQIFEISQKILFLGKNKISLLSFSFAFSFTKSEVFSDVIDN